MNWNMIGVLSGVIFIFGCIMVAAAKSIFATKAEHNECVKIFNSKLYDKGVTIFVPRIEWEKSRDERERRRDINQRALCGKIEKMSTAMETVKTVQDKTNQAISHLLGRFEQYIETTIKKGD